MRRLQNPRRTSGNALLLALCASLGAAPAFAQQGSQQGSHRPVAARAPAAQQPAAPQPAVQGEQFADGIAAIVNKDVITLREVRQAAQEAVADLQRRKIAVPDNETLQRQVLQRLIMERLERQEADRLGIRVDNPQIDQAVTMVATRNKLSVDQLRAEVQKSGVSWEEYRRTLRDEIRLDRLRQRTVDSSIIITDADIDAFLKDQARGGGQFGAGGAPSAPAAAQAAPQAAGPVSLTLAQILVRVPEGSSPEAIAALRKKAEDLLARARKGDDFASLAAAGSDGPEALQGGQMGSRPLDGWPDLFIRAVGNLPAGQVSDLVQSGNGFHILKVVARSGGGAAPQGGQQPATQPGGQFAAPTQANQGPVRVTQTHARHILIKTSAVMTDQQARERLEQVRQRIASGSTTFEAMARQYSQDATAPQGGDLGWTNPGEMVPTFEAAMNALQPNEISQPVQSPFGWHLIQVLERREQDVTDEMQRMQARQILFERRAAPAFEDWLENLRGQAYIDNRLEKRETIEQRYR
ncbi:peptidyl-prolyl cis-trans isomerase [Bordetella ansorpii]|uniref:Chaperone SurA n=1 Tax=Bordetella ansorpii TaxID=288768 RepID=A0A157L782_9BORD|nr:peptidylprolyl isomerase [Bordetella ansorpii]SAH92500.1 peptidyl-prolyl cis-trans isomerase [Bordetella ansorpii]